MSTIINATTTNGVVIQPDNSGSLVLQTNNGTTALTISTAQDTTLAGKLTTASTGIQFSDASSQTAAASPYVLKNRIINGDMRIDQRNGGASVTPATDSYNLDRWYYFASQASKFTIQQNKGAITPPTGFSNYLGMSVASAVSVAAADYFGIYQAIEGFNTADLGWGTANAKTVTLSFQVYSSLTGTFGGSIRNSAQNRSYPFTYTISTANTWTTISVTIAGDTSGTWLTTNGTGINVNFNLGAGTTYSTTAGAWAAGQYVAPTGAVSVVGTASATFYITGVQLEVGSTATPFERRLYNQELANCQRYYQKLNGYIETNADATHFAYSNWLFKVSMRASPTVTNTSGTGTLYNYSVDGVSSYAVQYSNIYQNATASAEL